MAATKKKKRKTPAKARSRGSSRSPAAKGRGKSEQELMRQKQILGIVLIALALLLLFNFILAPDPKSDVNVLGLASLFIIMLLRFFAGTGAVALPIFLLAYGIMVCADRNVRGGQGRLLGLFLIFIAFLGYLQLSETLSPFASYMKVAAAGAGGGLFGALLDFVFLKLVGRLGALIFLTALLLIGVLQALQTTLNAMFGQVGSGWLWLRTLLNHQGPARDSRPQEAAPAANPAASRSLNLLTEMEPAAAPGRQPVAIIQHDALSSPMISETPAAERQAPSPPPQNAFVRKFMPEISVGKPAPKAALDLMGEAQANDPPRTAAPAPEPEQTASALPQLKKKPRPKEGAAESPARPGQARGSGDYALPPADLIEAGVKVKNPRLSQAITENIGVLESTLDSFGVKATVTQVVAGPSVTRYELQPAPGVKVARITSLTDDIALTLAAQSVRIEAPIPGKSAIGIEVARKSRDTVYFREMIDSEEFRSSKASLSFVLGKNIGGEAVVGDLVKMPHLLIAGTTGSGKSVCINGIICSLLYKNRPDQVKLMLIDPKKVEMTLYNDLPHLIAPVVNDSKKAANALKWVVNEMENRYSLFVADAVKDFDGYNKLHPLDPLCHIVVIIDELADLMMVARHDVEDSICRIAQMARAAGIHLVVATQRPSVDVVTGLIKANIPSRIALSVSSFTDSRTIIDMGGAEKLLGNGDMLYAPMGVNKPLRVQGSFISEADVARLVDYCRRQAQPEFSPAAVEAANGIEKADVERDEDLDELFYDAGMLIIGSGQASTSYLQRRLSIGNPRAARLMDTLEQKGVVGGPNGSKPREILLSLEEFEETYG